MDNSDNSTTNQPIVHLENLTISHENGLLLTAVNLSLNEGEVVYLIGCCAVSMPTGLSTTASPKCAAMT